MESQVLRSRLPEHLWCEPGAFLLHFGYGDGDEPEGWNVAKV